MVTVWLLQSVGVKGKMLSCENQLIWSEEHSRSMKQSWATGVWAGGNLCWRNQWCEVAQWEWSGWILELDYRFLRPFLMESEHVFNLTSLGLFKEVWYKKLFMEFETTFGTCFSQVFHASSKTSSLRKTAILLSTVNLIYFFLKYSPNFLSLK